MPALPNQRQERFAQELVKGNPPYKAYEEAGYTKHRGNCYRMRDNERVKERITELQDEVLFDLRIDLEELTNMWLNDRKSAREAGQFGTAKACVDSIAKAHGYMIDRKEIGSVGEFDQLSTEELIERTRAIALELVEDERGAFVPSGAGEATE